MNKRTYWPSWKVTHLVQLPSGGREISKVCYVAAPSSQEAMHHAEHELGLNVTEATRA